MANWAIVVGINRYWNPTANLNGAVNDALDVTRWLTNQNGGSVPPRNLYLLTRPENPQIYPDGAPLQPEIRKYDAISANLTRVVADLINKSGGAGERFFFYFSGHGLTNRENFTDEQALVMADFEELLPNNAMTLSSIRSYFKGTNFTEQFFIIDACRNILPWKKEFIVGKLPFVLQPVDNSQFVLFATAPRLKAVELKATSGERGAFTQVLLNGLAGTGTAKIYDKINDEYIVRVDRLFKYVEDEMDKQNLLISKPPEPPIYQRPRKIIDSGGDSPVLAEISVADVKPLKLEVFVDPQPAWNKTKISILSEDGDYDEEITPVSNVPLVLTKPTKPMSYTIRASAIGYKPEMTRWAFDLYEEPKQIYVKLNDSPDILIKDDDDDVFRSGGIDFGTKHFENLSHAKASLTLKSDDPLAPLEITDNSGKLLVSGSGNLTLAQLAPGFYRARLVTPEDKITEQVIELREGESETVNLEAPISSESPLFDEIISQTDFFINNNDNTVRISEYIGSVATPQLTTLLALAGSAVSNRYGWEEKTRTLGLKSFEEATIPNTQNGINIISADEVSSGQGGNFLSEVRLQFWRQDELPTRTSKFIPSKKIEGLASFAEAAPPGTYFLSVEAPNRPRAIFSLAVLPNRVTLLILQQLVSGSLSVFGFAPRISINEDFQFQQNNALDLRRFELLQRYYFSERINDRNTYENADELLKAKWLDPFAGCLGGYTMIRLNKAERLRQAAHNMKNHFGELSDSYILMAEFLKSQPGAVGQVEKYYVNAIEKGIPVFSDGLERLVQAIKQYAIKHPLVPLINKAFENRVRNTIWTVWTDNNTDVSDTGSAI